MPFKNECWAFELVQQAGEQAQQKQKCFSRLQMSHSIYKGTVHIFRAVFFDFVMQHCSNVCCLVGSLVQAAGHSEGVCSG